MISEVGYSISEFGYDMTRKNLCDYIVWLFDWNGAHILVMGGGIIKPGACGPASCTRLVSWNRFVREHRYVCMCVSARGINNKITRNNWIKQFYGFSFLYMTLAINKLNGCGFSNNASHERLPKKTNMMWY